MLERLTEKATGQRALETRKEAQKVSNAGSTAATHTRSVAASTPVYIALATACRCKPACPARVAMLETLRRYNTRVVDRDTSLAATERRASDGLELLTKRALRVS